MALLNKTSLYKTVDNVNEAIFYGKKISKADARSISSWISSRYDTEYSYNHSYGLTKKDMNSPVCTFTGERLLCASTQTTFKLKNEMKDSLNHSRLCVLALEPQASQSHCFLT